MNNSNTGSSEANTFNNVNVNGNFANGVGYADQSTYNFHGDQHGWMDSAQQDELFGKLKKITEPVERMRLYSRKLGVDPKKKDIRVRSQNGYIPADELVHLAAGVGDCQAIDLLQSKYAANVNTNHQDGWRPIHRAAEGGQVESMNMLAGRYQVDVGKRTDNRSKSAFIFNKLALLHIAAWQGRLNVINLLAGKLGPQTVKLGSLQPLVREGHKQVNPFPATEDDKNTDAENEENTNAEDDENTNTEDDEIANAEDDENADAENDSALPAERLIQWIPGDPNVRSNYKWTPMHFAALNDKRNVVEIIEKLIEIGGKVDLKDYDKWTPLHVAAWKGNWVAVQTLLKEGANMNAKCYRPYGATPLCLAKLARKSAVEKSELDKYALVVVILNSWGALDRSVVDEYIGNYSGAFYLRSLLESTAYDVVDNKWLKKLSAKFPEKKPFAEDSKATDIVNEVNDIDISAIIERPIRYNIMLQALVLSLLLFLTFLFFVIEGNIQGSPGSLIWTVVLSIFEILAHIFFGLSAGQGKPSGTVAHYLIFLFTLTVFWILTCIPLHYNTAFCDYWQGSYCSNLNVTEGLAWTVFAFHLLHIITIFKQVYKYFPPDVLTEENVVKVEIVDGKQRPPLANDSLQITVFGLDDEKL